MPGGLTLLASTNAGIPTPASGKVTIFYSTDLLLPAYKDDTGTVHSLLGPTGAVGPQGVAGETGETGDSPIALPGPQGNPGVTGPQGPLGVSVVTEEVYIEDLIPSFPRVRPSGAWELIATQALSGAALYDFNNLSQYTDLRVLVIGVTYGTSAQTQVRISVDNGATFLAASGDYVSVSGAGAPTNTTELIPYSGTHTAARAGEVFIQGSNIVNAPKVSRSTVFSTDNVYLRYMPTNSAINGLRVLSSTAVNFTGGTAYIFGRR